MSVNRRGYNRGKAKGAYMYFPRLLILPAAALFTMAPAWMQTPRPSTGVGNNPSGSIGAPSDGTRGTNPNNPSPFPSPSSTSPFPSETTRPMLLTGKVVLDDGSAPGEPVLIERICLGRPHPEGYSDAKGHFSITLGQEQNMLPDASETPARNTATPSNPTGGVRESDLMNCDLRASLAGFRSQDVSLANRRYLDDPNVGTIVLHRMANIEGLTISATSAMAPKDARKAYEKGLESVKKKKIDDAQKNFEKATGIYPKYASAWFDGGRPRASSRSCAPGCSTASASRSHTSSSAGVSPAFATTRSSSSSAP